MIRLQQWFCLAVAVSLLAFPQALSAETSANASMGLYINLDWSSTYTPLDPMTLGDPPGAAPLSWPENLPEGAYPEFAISADASTYVYVTRSGARIYNGWGGPLRHSIPLDGYRFIASLSQDGRYLTLEEGLGCGPSGCEPRTWHTYDTNTGALLADTIAPDRNQAWPTMFAPGGTRAFEPVYDLAGESSAVDPGPWPLAIVTYDLLTGEETARLPVPGIVGGDWAGDPVDGGYVGIFNDPAIALSPDGATIAVIDSGMEQLVLIDTTSMEIRDVHTIAQPTGLVRDFLTWAGILPQTAQAKVGEGRNRDARWSADGRSLYVTGYETSLVEGTAEASGSGFGLTHIDASSGDILNHIWDGREVDGYNLIVVPDGSSLYVMVNPPWWEPPANEPIPYTLYRLDPENLDVLAERTFTQWPHLKQLPIEG